MSKKQRTKSPWRLEMPGRQEGKGVGAETGWQDEDIINRASVPLIKTCWDSSTLAPH